MKKMIYRILMIICLCVFSYSAYQLFEIYQEAHMIKEETSELEKHVVKKDKDKKNYLEPDWKALKESNGDIVGWLYVPSLQFSFPIVQGADNAFYLNHTAKKESNYRGAIFMNYMNNSQFADPNTIIYGHSVEGGGMFTDIKKYADAQFFKDNLEFYILTPQENYRCTIYTFAKTTEDSIFYSQVLNPIVAIQMKNEAYHVNEAIDVENQRMVTLSTCDLDYGFNSLHRLAINAIIEVTDKPIEME